MSWSTAKSWSSSKSRNLGHDVELESHLDPEHVDELEIGTMTSWNTGKSWSSLMSWKMGPDEGLETNDVLELVELGFGTR